jgi:signal transduction histidine kinase
MLAPLTAPSGQRALPPYPQLRVSIRTDPITLPAADPVRLRVNKLELLERLADDLAHEIKNPLHSMVSNLEVLKRRAARVSGEGAEDLQRYAGVLAAELERVNRRIELLLRLSRPARGAELATLGELVEELLELIQLEARHHEVEVDYHPGDRAVRVRLPRETGRQILLNLVLDALKGAGHGARLGLSLGHSHDQAHLSVTCDGGQPADRESAADDRLAIVAALVAGVGGTLEDGGAARRRVTLPLAHG